MAAAEELQEYLEKMTEEQIEAFVSPLRSGTITYHTQRYSVLDGPHTVPANPDEPTKTRLIRSILKYQYEDPPYFDRICRAAKIKTDADRSLDYTRAQSEAATRANRISVFSLILSLIAIVISVIALRKP